MAAVHQDDPEEVKGVWRINVVDGATRWQQVGSVAANPKALPIPVLAALMESCPFWIEGLRCGCGTKYVNRPAGVLRSRLHAGEFPGPRTGSPMATRLWSAGAPRRCVRRPARPTSGRNGRMGSMRSIGTDCCRFGLTVAQLVSPKGTDTEGV